MNRTVDITTIGRRTGTPRRIEIWQHQLDGRTYITGLPGRRGWYANVLAEPSFTLHDKRGVNTDRPARARPVTDPDERRELLARILAGLGREERLERWVADSPLIEVQFEDA